MKAYSTLGIFCFFSGVVMAADGGYNLDPTSREAARLFYQTVYAASDNIADGWTGSVASCNAGTVNTAYQNATLRRINWFRAMAGIPANVTLDATFNQKAQQAALMMSANNSLSHSPPSTWLCYTAAGAEGASKSNLGLGHMGASGVSNGVMRETGSNNAPVGHRRWLLYPQTTRMGVGDVPSTGSYYSGTAMWVQDGNFGATRPTVRDTFVAWPPKGYVSYTVVYPRWSFSYPGANFSSARVTMTENGSSINTKLETVANGYGENTLVWLPGSYTDGSVWEQPNGDTVYNVTLSNVVVNGQTRTFTYTVTVFDPQKIASDTPNQTPQGSTTLGAGKTETYTFNPSPAATESQWRASNTAAYSLTDGAENGLTNFTANTTSGYSVVTSDAASAGSKSFHLAHIQPVDQILTLKNTLVPLGNASIRFDSRWGWAGTGQNARLEASTNDGGSWTTLYQQNGSTSNFGEKTFTTRTVSLAAFAGKSLQLRFRYSVDAGQPYSPQTSAGAGWYIDNIQITGTETLTATTTPAATTGNAFSFTAPSSGSSLLQVRSGMYGYFGDWSAALRVNTTGTGTGTTTTPTECLLNWAERAVPSVLSPATTTRNDIPPFNYRFYTASNSALAISTTDSHVYYYAAGRLNDLGHQSTWLTQAGCQ
ncbi:MAG: hypothetical protein RIR79_1905 [Pseudomonadota bacterium]|jgi:hypothetical protein